MNGKFQMLTKNKGGTIWPKIFVRFFAPYNSCALRGAIRRFQGLLVAILGLMRDHGYSSKYFNDFPIKFPSPIRKTWYLLADTRQFALKNRPTKGRAAHVVATSGHLIGSTRYWLLFRAEEPVRNQRSSI